MTTNELFSRLYSKYNRSGYLFFDELSNATGALANRRADAAVLGIWPSTGYALQGFEIKVSKADLDKEINDVEKWEAIGKYCDRWWLVVSDKSIVDMQRLPAVWGVMYPTKMRLKVYRPAPKLTPEPWAKRFAISMILNYGKTFEREKLQQDRSLNSKYQEGYADGQKITTTTAAEKHRLLAKAVAEFEEASGLKIDRYNGEYLGKGVAAHLKNKTMYANLKSTAENVLKRIETMRKCAESCIEKCDCLEKPVHDQT